MHKANCLSNECEAVTSCIKVFRMVPLSLAFPEYGDGDNNNDQSYDKSYC